MTKDRYLEILEGLLEDHYKEIKVKCRASEQRKHYIEGYMQAARALGALTYDELREAVGKVHLRVFGKTFQERQQSVRDELSPDDPSLDIPAYVRQGTSPDQ